jgi:long-subunit acyl-CoA synthetase (AMP-forming)
MPLGRPIANTRLYVLDGEGEPVPVGVKGELYIAGDGVSAGYVGDAERTGERFVAGRFGETERMYRSGDVVRYLPDGNIEFVERMDDQVKIRGYRVELGEVQAVLEGHAAVRQAVVLVREGRLQAWVGVGERRVSGEELREHVRRRLPEYMVPSGIVVMASLPLTKNGKIDRQGLAAGEEEPELEGPRTEVEEAVAGVWREVLERERIGVEENFFQIGGHSLAAIRIASRLRSLFGFGIPMSTIFEQATIRRLAGWLEQSRGEFLARSDAEIVPATRVILTK